MISDVPVFSHQYSVNYDVVPGLVAIFEVLFILVVVLSPLNSSVNHSHECGDKHSIVLHESPQEGGHVAEPETGSVDRRGS